MHHHTLDYRAMHITCSQGCTRTSPLWQGSSGQEAHLPLPGLWHPTTFLHAGTALAPPIHSLHHKRAGRAPSGVLSKRKQISLHIWRQQHASCRFLQHRQRGRWRVQPAAHSINHAFQPLVLHTARRSLPLLLPPPLPQRLGWLLRPAPTSPLCLCIACLCHLRCRRCQHLAAHSGHCRVSLCQHLPAPPQLRLRGGGAVQRPCRPARWRANIRAAVFTRGGPIRGPTMRTSTRVLGAASLAWKAVRAGCCVGLGRGCRGAWWLRG